MTTLPRTILAACLAVAGCGDEAPKAANDAATPYASCESSASTGDGSLDVTPKPQPSAPAQDAGLSAPPPAENAISRLPGRYAHFDVVAYEDGDTHTLIITYGFTDFYLKAGSLYAQEIFCHAEQASNQPMKSDVPDAFTRAILPVPAPVAVRVNEDGRFVLWRTETPTPIGVKLDDPAHERLPSDPKDPRFTDSDGDGKPGVTVHLELANALKVDLYIGRREIFAYEVTEQADRSLRGRVYDHSEQTVLGSSNPLFTPSGQFLQHVDLEKSPIVLIPVAAQMTCDELIAQRDTLFGKPPAAW